MNYVKHFSINGIDTKQVACIELNGRPNAATEGAVGVLGLDVTSPTREVYKCVAVNGSIYTWELLSSRMSLISANITGEGVENKSFPYSTLRIPDNYVIQVGDLILDCEGYLYRIIAIGNESCDTTYSGAHFTGAGGVRDYKLQVSDGKLQLVTVPGGNIMSEVDYLVLDENTTSLDASTGAIKVIGIYTIGGTIMKLFHGTQAEYESLPEAQKVNLFPIQTDNPYVTHWEYDLKMSILDSFFKRVDNIVDGTIAVRLAEKASKDAAGNDIATTYLKKSDAVGTPIISNGARVNSLKFTLVGSTLTITTT